MGLLFGGLRFRGRFCSLRLLVVIVVYLVCI